MSDQASTAKTFHVSKAGNTSGESLGPWTIEEIASRLASAEIAITDFVYSETSEDWIALVEFEDLKMHLRKAKPKAPPKASQPKTEPTPQLAPIVEAAPVVVAAPVAATAPVAVVVPTPVMSQATASRGANGEWYVQKGTLRHGPFSYLSLIRALQEKSVYEFDFVWTEGMEDWTRLAEHEAFTTEKMKAMNDTAQKSGEALFTKRAHPRHRFESDVIVNDNRSAWVGRAFEGSVGGSGLVIENAASFAGTNGAVALCSRRWSSVIQCRGRNRKQKIYKRSSRSKNSRSVRCSFHRNE